MKKLIILLSLIVISCAGLSKSLDIHVSEIEILEAAYCIPQNPWVHMHVYRIKGTVAVAMVVISRGLTIRYAYLDGGEVVALQLDTAAFQDNERKEYILDPLTDEQFQFLMDMFNRVMAGKPPLEIEEKLGA